MKIISRGNPPDDKPIRFECSHCNTVFEATREEARVVPDERDGWYWFIGCPVCNRVVTKAGRS
jgi:uncharacterized C2H2 Zn-finger protein